MTIGLKPHIQACLAVGDREIWCESNLSVIYVAVKTHTTIHFDHQSLNTFLEGERKATEVNLNIHCWPSSGGLKNNHCLSFLRRKGHLPVCSPLLYHLRPLIQFLSNKPTDSSGVDDGDFAIVSINRRKQTPAAQEKDTTGQIIYKGDSSYLSLLLTLSNPY